MRKSRGDGGLRQKNEMTIFLSLIGNRIFPGVTIPIPNMA